MASKNDLERAILVFFVESFFSNQQKITFKLQSAEIRLQFVGRDQKTRNNSFKSLFQSWNGSKAEARLFFFALKIGEAASNNPSDEAIQDHQSRSFNANEAVEVANNDSCLAFQCCNCSVTFFVHH